MTIRPGQEWARPALGSPDLEISGDDADLAAQARATPGALVRFVPSGTCDLARAIGLTGAPEGNVEVALDALAFDDGALACNMVILGTAPRRLRRWSRRFGVTVEIDGTPWYSGPATTVVVASGQFLAGSDLVPRGHPGDGRAEVQVYAVKSAERRAVRRRLPSGNHLPHPGIAQRSGRQIEVWTTRPVEVAVDRRAIPRRDHFAVAVRPGAIRVLL